LHPVQTTGNFAGGIKKRDACIARSAHVQDQPFPPGFVAQHQLGRLVLGPAKEGALRATGMGRLEGSELSSALQGTGTVKGGPIHRLLRLVINDDAAGAGLPVLTLHELNDLVLLITIEREAAAALPRAVRRLLAVEYKATVLGALTVEEDHARGLAGWVRLLVALDNDAGRAGRIVLSRPAVEAGESLGFLPGALEEKLAPYLRPLYDCLTERLGTKRLKALVAEGTIEIAPVAYMRGRTLNDCFIVIDEAQNCTYGQLKMLLTRLGWRSTMVLTGDPDQTDLLSGLSGLGEIASRLERVPEIAVVRLGDGDIVRHPLVASMLTVL